MAEANVAQLLISQKIYSQNLQQSAADNIEYSLKYLTCESATLIVAVHPNFPFGNRYGKANSSQWSSLKTENDVLSCTGAIFIFSSLIIFGISDTKDVFDFYYYVKI